MATRRHGRNGRLMVSLDGVAAPTTIPFTKSFKVSGATRIDDATAYGDSNEIGIPGLPSFSGSYEGFCDTDAPGLFKAAADGLPRQFFFYDDFVNKPNTYFYGSAYWTQDYDSAVDSVIKVSGQFSAAGKISRVIDTVLVA